jgi:hypothetical protein
MKQPTTTKNDAPKPSGYSVTLNKSESLFEMMSRNPECVAQSQARLKTIVDYRHYTHGKRELRAKQYH